ncbi:hypothetical protein E2C01_036180 [Portunus trituberculatus]|uniref:Uncharacterized protein n=1 Tax=Portunus trituberculatus TaxID=210409 RepID=A0A5B7FAI9_PORTR|nr:hypothetical protein [Portunus trituberculatus]
MLHRLPCFIGGGWKQRREQRLLGCLHLVIDAAANHSHLHAAPAHTWSVYSATPIAWDTRAHAHARTIVNYH